MRKCAFFFYLNDFNFLPLIPPPLFLLSLLLILQIFQQCENETLLGNV